MNFTGLMDMFDGGGAGRAGQKFEGGGLLSEIANMVAKPAGYKDRMQQKQPQQRPVMGSRSPMVAPGKSASQEPEQGQMPSMPTDPGVPQLPQQVYGRYGNTPIEEINPELLMRLLAQGGYR